MRVLFAVALLAWFACTLARPVVHVIVIEQDTTEGASAASREAITRFLDLAGYESNLENNLIEAVDKRDTERLFKSSYTNDETFPSIPDAWELLQVAKENSIEYLCFVRIKYNAESVWASLGPKTKGVAIIDATLISAERSTLILRSRGVKAESTRVEKGWETAASLVVSSGFTVFSGGPKTPHLSKAVQLGLAKVFEPIIPASQ